MKKINTPKGAGNAHAQTEAYKVNSVSIYKTIKEDIDSDYTLFIDTTKSYLTLEQLCALPEVIEKAAEKNIDFSIDHIVQLEKREANELLGNGSTDTLYYIHFNIPTGINALYLKTKAEYTLLTGKVYKPMDINLPKGRTVEELAQELAEQEEEYEELKKRHLKDAVLDYGYFAFLTPSIRYAKFKLTVNSSRPEELTLQEVLELEEVKQLMKANDILLTAKMVKHWDFGKQFSATKNPKFMGEHHFIYFDVTGEDYLNKIIVDTNATRIQVEAREEQLKEQPEQTTWLKLK